MPIRPENRARYPKDWKVRSFFVRFVRARGRCEWCGVEQYSIVERGGGRKVTGAHESYAEARQALADLYASHYGVEGSVACPWSIVVLTTAHVFDDRPEASSLLNLAALCQKCHNGHDMKDRAQRRRERIEAESGQVRMFA